MKECKLNILGNSGSNISKFEPVVSFLPCHSYINTCAEQ